MLIRAKERISAVSCGLIHIMQGDIRNINFPANQFDIILAAAVLHHLRGKDEWESVFKKFHCILKPGGSIWIVDLIQQSTNMLNEMMKTRYGAYLSNIRDDAFRDRVFDYIEKEDSPRPLMFQLSLLQEAGFEQVEILHKNNLFAAFGAIKYSE
jgi:tRNA (cmo5U34)-methyltransferase